MPDLGIFLVVLFAIAALVRLDFFFSILYLFVAVYLLSRLWTRRAVANLEARRRYVERAFPGEGVDVELRVASGGWLPLPWVELHESLPVELASPPFYHEVFALGPREGRRLRYRLRCRRRGYYELGPLELRSGDLWGVVAPTQQKVASQPIIVYPRVLPLERLGLPTHSPLVALRAHSPLFEDPARIMGVRAYRRGDSLRRIHWTATASTGELLVKQYEPAIARDTLVCLDLDVASYGPRQRYHAPELAIVTAASVANHIVVREGLSVGLATVARDPLAEEVRAFSLPPRKGRGHLMRILEVLARAEPVEGTESFAVSLRDASARLSWGSTVVVVTGREDEALVDALVHLHHSGFAVALILVKPTPPSVTLRGRGGQLGVPVYHVWREEEVQAMEGGR
jgi:uncharacterized protein (DUF58 family)